MDRIQDSTRYSSQWPLEDQHDYEETLSTSDRPSSSHIIAPDYLHHPQHGEAGTSAMPRGTHFPSASVEYSPPDDYYYQSQSQPITRPGTNPFHSSNQRQYQYSSSDPYSQSHDHASETSQATSLDYPDYRRPESTVPSFSSYHDTQQSPFIENPPPHFQPIEHPQENPYDSSNTWQPVPYASSFSSNPTAQQFPFSDSRRTQLQPVIRPQAMPFDSSNQWQHHLYSPAIVPHFETPQHTYQSELPQAGPFDSSTQMHPAAYPSAVSSHPETLQYPSFDPSSLRIQKTPQQRLAPYVEETSERIKEDLVPLNHLMSLHPQMIIHQFRILPALERDTMRLDDVLRCISYTESGDPHVRIKGFKTTVKKYHFGSLSRSNKQGGKHLSFKSDLNSSNYAHLLRALEIITPLERTCDLKRSKIGFIRSLYYFTGRPRVSRAVIAKDFGIEPKNVADMIANFANTAKTANIGFLKFKDIDQETGRFIESPGHHTARYYHWKPTISP